ncbi:MAG: four helix bundle protein [Bacteroidota bacterium]
MGFEELKKRFRQFAIDTAVLIQKLPRNAININYSNQLVRCSSSSGANYWAASRAKSTADFINKLKIVEEELDESIYFLDLLLYFNEPLRADFEKLMNEGDELLAIIVKSIKTARLRQR